MLETILGSVLDIYRRQECETAHIPCTHRHFTCCSAAHESLHSVLRLTEIERGELIGEEVSLESCPRGDG